MNTNDRALSVSPTSVASSLPTIPFSLAGDPHADDLYLEGDETSRLLAVAKWHKGFLVFGFLWLVGLVLVAAAVARPSAWLLLGAAFYKGILGYIGGFAFACFLGWAYTFRSNVLFGIGLAGWLLSFLFPLFLLLYLLAIVVLNVKTQRFFRTNSIPFGFFGVSSRLLRQKRLDWEEELHS